MILTNDPYLCNAAVSHLPDWIVLVPIFLTNAPHAIGLSLPVALQKQIELMVFGGLIVFFLIVEPHGLARLWQIAKEKLRLWPFPH